MEFYPWVVIAHVVMVILSFGAHGVSAFTMYRVRVEPDRSRLAAVLDLSTTALLWAGIGLLVAVVLGIVAAMMGGHFGRLWPWVSIVLVVVVWFAMTPLAARPLNGVRRELGIPNRSDAKGSTPVVGSDAALATAQAQVKPTAVAAVGVVAIVLLVWLMEMKPF